MNEISFWQRFRRLRSVTSARSFCRAYFSCALPPAFTLHNYLEPPQAYWCYMAFRCFRHIFIRADRQSFAFFFEILAISTRLLMILISSSAEQTKRAAQVLHDYRLSHDRSLPPSLRRYLHASPQFFTACLTLCVGLLAIFISARSSAPISRCSFRRSILLRRRKQPAALSISNSLDKVNTLLLCHQLI